MVNDKIAEEKINFIIDLGRAFHEYGASSMRLEQALEQVSLSFNLEGQFFCMPTSLLASFYVPGDGYMSRMERVSPGGVDLEKLSLVDELCDQVLSGHLSITEGRKALKSIRKRKPRYSSWLVVFCFALTSACLTIFLNARPIDSICSFLVGGMIGYITIVSGQHPRFARVYEALSAIVATMAAYLLTLIFPNVTPNVVILASLIVLIPGLSLTISMSELATQNLVAGSARFMEAMTVLLKLIFGVLIATKLMQSFVIVEAPSTAPSLPLYYQWFALAVAAVCFSVLFSAHSKDQKWVFLAAILGFTSTKLGSLFLGPEVGVFIGGVVVGAGSNLFARFIKRPATITMLPGIILLVPGSVGFRGLSMILDKNTLSGIDTAFSVFIISIGLVAGLLFGNLLVTPKKSL
ncbi:MAG: threonine/serine exporter family protein [Bdellovibrionales bacterium]|nr:threonine/serine exporter family protein [Bdellovibrionales bacterium]